MSSVDSSDGLQILVSVFRHLNEPGIAANSDELEILRGKIVCYHLLS